MNRDQALRQHVLYLLRGGGAHCDYDRAVADLPEARRGEHPESVPHTPWRLIEHMRLAQWDILEFCQNPSHVSPDFPDGFWPDSDGPPNSDAWEKSIESFHADMNAMQALVEDTNVDLYEPIPHGDGQTVLREALLVADHNAYHIGQLVAVRRALGAWNE